MREREREEDSGRGRERETGRQWAREREIERDVFDFLKTS